MEEFGLPCGVFRKNPTVYKMRGFSNTATFFEDTDPGIKEKRLNPRTRDGTGVPYRINTNGKPGSTSLIKTTQDDENKLLMVTVFRVVQAKGRKDRWGQTGRSGFGPRLQTRRQPVRDKQSYAGSFCGENKIELSFSLDGPSEQIILTDKDEGKTLEFGSRKYLIREINVEEKKLVDRKARPAERSGRTEKLSLP